MNDKKLVLLFSLSAIIFFGLLVGGAAWRQGWFMPRETFHVKFDDASGLSDGTPIFLMGLRVGNVDGIELDADGKIDVTLKILGRYSKRLHADAIAKAERTFVIGERVIKLQPGLPESGSLKPGSYLQGHVSMELVDLLSGGKMAEYFSTFHMLMTQVKLLVEAAGGEDGNLIEMYQQMFTALKSVETLSQDVRILRKDVFATEDTKTLLSNLSKSSQKLQTLVNEMNRLMPNVNDMSGDMKEVLPDLARVMKEGVVTLQAMQRSYFLRSQVEDIKEEEAEAAQERQTASEK